MVLEILIFKDKRGKNIFGRMFSFFKFKKKGDL